MAKAKAKAKAKPKDRRKSTAKGLVTKAKNQKAQAKALLEQAKGDYSRAGDRLRNEAKKLREQAKRKETKAKEIRREIRAEKNKLTVGEQAILDRLRTQKAREIRKANVQARKEASQIPNFNTVFIDTVKEKCSEGRGGSTLNTPVAYTLNQWIDKAIDAYGENIVAFVCEKALETHPYIFDSYIYQSDQSGYLSSDALFVLNRYAELYITFYESEEFDETALEIDDDDGSSEIYF